MVMVGNCHQGEEAVIHVYLAYFKIICAMGVECRNKNSALFHIIYISTYRLRNELLCLDVF